MYGPEFEAKVDRIVGRYPRPRAALLPVLWEVQRLEGGFNRCSFQRLDWKLASAKVSDNEIKWNRAEMAELVFAPDVLNRL